MEQVLAGYLAAVNLAAFLLMGADKRRARRGGWRVSEKTLFLFPALGGALGGLLGMKVFRHKIRKAKFKVGILVILTAQCLGAMAVRWVL